MILHSIHFSIKTSLKETIMKFLTKVKTVVGSVTTVIGESFVNADLLVEEVSFSPRIPKVISWANVAAQALRRNAKLALLAKPRDKRVWKIAIAANAAGCVTAGLCYAFDKENYRAATFRYVGRCLQTGDKFANTLIAVKEAA